MQHSLPPEGQQQVHDQPAVTRRRAWCLLLAGTGMHAFSHFRCRGIQQAHMPQCSHVWCVKRASNVWDAREGSLCVCLHL